MPDLIVADVMYNGECYQQSQTSHLTAPLIAVIDDDHAVCSALTNLLHSAGYNACSFDCAEKFLASDALRRVHCAIIDIHLGSMSGFALKEHLLQLKMALPVVFISGNASQTERDRAEQLGALALLFKPIDADTVLSYIKNITAGTGV